MAVTRDRSGVSADEGYQAQKRRHCHPYRRSAVLDGMDPSAGAASVLRQARRRAGLSQVELARRAGVTQSVISVYESGRRQPSVAKLSRLVDAAGSTLEIGLGDAEAPADIPLLAHVQLNAGGIRRAVSAHGMRALGVFGSVARGEATAESDIDLLIDVPTGIGLLALGRLREELSTMLEAEIDLVPEAGLKPSVRESVMDDLVPL